MSKPDPIRRTAHSDAVRRGDAARRPRGRQPAQAVPLVRISCGLVPPPASAAVCAHSCRWRKGSASCSRR